MRSATLTLIGMAAAAALVVGQARATESYDKEATEMVLRRAARIVKENCGHAKDENGRAVGPWGATKVTVTLGRNGHSKSTAVAAPFEGTPPGRCAVQAFSNLTFPPFNGPEVTLDWEVEIVRPPSEPTSKSKKNG